LEPLESHILAQATTPIVCTVPRREAPE
jgi:hypothetical protein